MGLQGRLQTLISLQKYSSWKGRKFHWLWLLPPLLSAPPWLPVTFLVRLPLPPLPVPAAPLQLCQLLGPWLELLLCLSLPIICIKNQKIGKEDMWKFGGKKKCFFWKELKRDPFVVFVSM